LRALSHGFAGIPNVLVEQAQRVGRAIERDLVLARHEAHACRAELRHAIGWGGERRRGMSGGLSFGFVVSVIAPGAVRSSLLAVLRFVGHGYSPKMYASQRAFSGTKRAFSGTKEPSAGQKEREGLSRGLGVARRIRT